MHGGLGRREGDDDDLQEARKGNAPSERDAGLSLTAEPEHVEQNQDADQDDVEQCGRERGDGETAERIQHAGIERDQRHTEQIRESDAGEQNRELEFLRVLGETWCQTQHQPGHGEFAEQGEDHKCDGKAGQRLLGEGLRGARAVAMIALGEERDEGTVEGTFRE